MPTTVSLAIDAAATARLTRLITTDTFPPVRWARDRVLDRWPVDGHPVTDLTFRATRTEWQDGRTVIVHAETTPIGELVTCPWCASVWVAAGVILARRVAPAWWDPVARLLAWSLAAGLAAHTTSDERVEIVTDNEPGHG